MLNKQIMVAILLIAGASFAQADTATNLNPHKTRDQKMRTCQQEADQQQLTADARVTYIAICMKK